VDVADQSVSVTVSRLKEAREAASTVLTGSFFTEFEQLFLGKVLDTGSSQLGQQLESCVPFICHLLDPDTEPSAVFDEEYIGTCSDLTELDDGSDTLTKLCQTLQTHYLPLWTGPAKEVRFETTEAAALGRPATTTTRPPPPTPPLHHPPPIGQCTTDHCTTHSPHDQHCPPAHPPDQNLCRPYHPHNPPHHQSPC